MSEDLNQKISQFMDNELEHADALQLLAALNAQPELQHKLHRYAAISYALKNQVYLKVKDDFSANIAEQIQQEPVPVIEQALSFKQTYQWLALAASLAIIAFILDQSFNAQLFKPAATLQMAQRWLPEQSDLNKLIGQYLKEHSFDAYAKSEVDDKPYGKVTTYNQK
jgi:sigma-E factor negative regulatory protein RseA